MNTKTVEQLREEYNAESPIPAIENITMYINWLEQKLLTPSPERGKEGKTAEENLKSFGKKDTSMQNNLSYPVYTEKEVIRLMELHAQSTSKPVEPKISVGEEIIKRAAEILLQAEDKGITSCQQKMRVVFETLNTEGLSMQQGRGEEWISVEDEQPEIGVIVNLILKHSKEDVYSGFRAKGGWYCFRIGEEAKQYIPNGIKEINITHWQPLPTFTQSKGTE